MIFVICVIGYTQQAIATESCIEDFYGPNIKSYNKIVLAKVVEKQETGPECYDDGTDWCHYTEKLTFEKIKNYKGNLSLTFYINNDYRYSPTYGYDLFDGPYLLKPNQLVLLNGDGKDNQDITPIYDCGGVIHLGKYDEKTDSNVYSHYLYDDDKYDTFESWLDSLLLSSPLKQIKSGILPQDIQCSVNHIHMVYDNIKHVCVNHNTATKLQERTGWEIISKVSTVTSEQPTTIEFDTVSTLEFVDDGREYPQALQRAPAPWLMDRYIKDFEYNPYNLNSEKYSLNPGVGFYVEDWIPTHVLEGQKILYIKNLCYEDSGDCFLVIQYVPKDFEYDKDTTTNHDLRVSKGYAVAVTYIAEQRDEIEDVIEHKKEIYSSQSGYYGGFTPMTHNGKPVLAFEGGTHSNYYRAHLATNVDNYIGYSVASAYHTLDEILPVFKSMMK
ncbi:MAG: hypothetical protein J4F36_14455 [Nitrosopumilaceae archaeon]|nr:hypothetical protein [Nitrosopumilaceae archaeon]